MGQTSAPPFYTTTWFLLVLCAGLVFVVITVFFLKNVYGFLQISKRASVILPYSANQTLLSSVPEPEVTNSIRADLFTVDDPTVGNPQAKIRIVAFEDFECQFCGIAYQTVRTITTKYKNDLIFQFRDFPIEETHLNAVIAAQAGECAHEQGKFWEMHDRMFQNQDKLTQSDLHQYAVQAGLDGGAFFACLTSGLHEQEVWDDFNDGIRAGVRGTPTFFVNGRMISGPIPLEKFEALIRALR